jgi:hypothetical protein
MLHRPVTSNPNRALFDDKAKDTAALLRVPVDVEFELDTTTLHAVVKLSTNVAPPEDAKLSLSTPLTVTDNLPVASTPILLAFDETANEIALDPIVVAKPFPALPMLHADVAASNSAIPPVVASASFAASFTFTNKVPDASAPMTLECDDAENVRRLLLRLDVWLAFDTAIPVAETMLLDEVVVSVTTTPVVSESVSFLPPFTVAIMSPEPSTDQLAPTVPA